MSKVGYRPARRNWDEAVFAALVTCLRDGMTGLQICDHLNAAYPSQMTPPLHPGAVWEFIRNNGGRERVLSGERLDRPASRGPSAADILSAPFAAQLAVIEDEVFRPSTAFEAEWAGEGARLWSRDPLTWEQVYALLRPGHARARDYGFYVRHPETGRREPVFDALLDEWMPFDEIVRRGRAYFTLGALMAEAAQ